MIQAQLHSKTEPESPSGLVAEDVGAVAVEYIVLVGFVALASLPAFIAMGVALVNGFESIRDIMLWPMP